MRTAGARIQHDGYLVLLSRETLIPTARPGMALWREKLFVSMQRNAGSVSTYFQIPTNRVIELGTQVEL